MAVKARAEITLSSIRDIQSVTRYYLLQSSTAAAPTKPTTNPPGGNWVTSEPTYTSGSTNSLYFVDCTVFSDNSFVYSDVSLSSSYEAAKVAYNKAENAESIVDNLEVGGRNLYIVKDARNGYINGSNGSVSGMNATNREQISDFIPVAEGEKLVFQAWAVTTATGSKAGSAWLGYAFYNSEKTYLGSRPSKYDGTVQADGYTYNFYKITVPANAAFIRCSYRRVTDGKAKLERGTLATGWTPAPEDLEAEVNAAQETADSKNTVYYQASAPTGGTYKTNDIWFDTNDGNKMYMYNGSTWVAEQFGNAAISDLSITNAKIANGTIESAKISNLDAGKVTSGTMSAARIKGDELKLGGDNNIDGVMKVYNADGDLVGSFTKEGLMAIAGQIGGWGIFSQVLKNEWDLISSHYRALLSPKEGLWLDETSLDQGMDPNGVYLNKVEYGLPGIIFTLRREINGAVRTGSSSIMGTFYDPDNEKGGIALGPHVIVEDGGADDPSTIDVSELYLKSLENNSYVRQPQLIMKGNVVVKNGSTNKNVVLCTIPTAYQSGYYIVPFVTRTFGGSGVPDDAGDFKYAYYNQMNYTVNLKLFNNLTSGVWYDYVYFIYALPKT